MRRVAMALVAMAVCAFAQESTKVISVKYADPRDMASLAKMYGANSTVNVDLKVVQVVGTSAQVAAAEAAIAKFDVAPKTIELVVHFVVGSDQSNLAGSVVPADIRDVIAQLKSTFTYKEYRMLDTLTLRTRAGSMAETSGVISNPAATSIPRMTQFAVRKASVSEDGVIRLDRLHAGLRIPVVTSSAAKVDYVNTGIDQDVDVKEGQKVVVGRASLEGPEKALFLILTAKVVQ